MRKKPCLKKKKKKNVFFRIASLRANNFEISRIFLLISCKFSRVNYPVPVHHASTRPLGTKKLSVLNLEMLETSMMA